MKITFTGVDHYTNLTQLAEMANQPGIEFGILYSVSQSINRIPRYPSEVFIKALMRDLPGCALHKSLISKCLRLHVTTIPMK
jgi:hypothetical protein